MKSSEVGPGSRHQRRQPADEFQGAQYDMRLGVPVVPSSYGVFSPTMT